MIEDFLHFTRPFPEPHLLVTADGNILAANPAAASLLAIDHRPTSTSLLGILADAPERVESFLRACARSGSFLPGSMSLRGNGNGNHRFRCEGAALHPRDGAPPMLTLRLRRHAEASHRFLLLNQKIDQLGREIFERQRVEDELQAQALQLEETAAELETAIEELEEQKEDAVAARIDAEQAARELASSLKRLELLSDAGDLLGVAPDHERALQSLAEFCTRNIADYCITYLLDDDDAVRRVGASHADPSRVGLVEDLQRLSPLSLEDRYGAGMVIRTGESVIAERITDELLQAAAQNGDHLELLRKLAPTASIIVPLEARGRILGALAVTTSASSRRPYTASDLKLVQELARRAALSIENLRLLHVSQEANRAKADFLAVMSHELRTPLNAIVGYVDLLDAEVRGPVTDGQREQLRRIDRSTRHLISIIEEILEFARLEAGREIVNAESVDLRQLAREIAESMEAGAHSSGLLFRLDLPHSPVLGTTDAAKLRQILLNLLSNAIKFTDAGEVGLTLTAAGNEAIFQVHDSGIGIGAEDMERVFEPFWQVQRGPTRRAGGTGLGLSVTRRLAALLDCDITLESVPGAGSRFFVRIPLDLRPGVDATHER